MATPKRVATLYRVSTKGQIDGDDIPMQKKACRDFIAKQGNWSLVKEYYEKGVSGFKLSELKRDVLQTVKRDAENELFDILLVFMMDRLGRREDETPFVVEFFVNHGIEVWSVKEGQRKIENHADKLMNYISFWQSSGESLKTAMRVSESHKQMVENGLFRGGSTPYGYKLIKSGLTNKKGKELLKLAIDEEQSEVVKEIYRLAHDELMGGLRIANALNDKNIPSKTGSKWNSAVINVMLRNPIYKGYMTFGKNSNGLRTDEGEWILADKPNPEIQIVSEEVWNKVFEIKKANSPKSRKDNTQKRFQTTKGKLLLVGMIKCGHCGSPLTTTYNYKKWVTVDGTEKTKKRILYRCSGKALGKTDCDGQTNYAKDKIEDIVIGQLNYYLSQLKKVDLTKEINKLKNKQTDENTINLKRLQKQNEENYKELAVLNEEVPKSIMGKSSFSPELLGNLIKKKEEDIAKIADEINKIEDVLKESNFEITELKDLQKHIPEWEDVFEKANDNIKKKMLSTLIDEVRVYREKVEIDIKMSIQDFISHGELSKVMRSPSSTNNTTHYLTKKISVQLTA